MPLIVVHQFVDKFAIKHEMKNVIDNFVPDINYYITSLISLYKRPKITDKQLLKKIDGVIAAINSCTEPKQIDKTLKKTFTRNILIESIVEYNHCNNNKCSFEELFTDIKKLRFIRNECAHPEGKDYDEKTMNDNGKIIVNIANYTDSLTKRGIKTIIDDRYVNKSSETYFQKYPYRTIFEIYLMTGNQVTDSEYAILLTESEKGDADKQFELANYYFDKYHKIRNRTDEKSLEIAGVYLKKMETWILASANNGNTYAEKILGYMYEDGRFVEASPSKSLKWRRKAAIHGDLDSQKKMGFLVHSDGRMKAALNWFKKAADQEDAESQYMVGDILCDLESYEESADYFKKSLKGGFLYASRRLGYYYGNGLVGQKDPEKSSEYFKKMIDCDESDTLYEIGSIFENGTLVKQSYDDAFRFYQKGIRAKDKYGIGKCNYKIGLFYENGYGHVEKNKNKALHFYKESDYYMAYYRLGQVYQNKLLGEKKSVDKSIEYYKKVPEIDYIDYLIFEKTIHDDYDGECKRPYDEKTDGSYWDYYFNMIGLKEQNGEKKATEGNPRAQWVEGNRCLKHDPVKAIEWYRKSAEQGFPYGELCYGWMLLENDDESKGFCMIKSSVDKGCKRGLYYLGYCYEKGWGTEISPEKSLKCFSEYARAWIEFKKKGYCPDNDFDKFDEL